MTVHTEVTARVKIDGEGCIEVDDCDILEVRPIDEVPRVRVVAAGQLDPQTELDLGLALRQMGQLDDAVLQFRKVLPVKEHQLYCRMMIGLCYLDQGLVKEGISELKNGLFLEETNLQQAVALRYELGRAYEAQGDVKEALYYFRWVARKLPRFRDTRRRIARLRQPRRKPPAPAPAPRKLPRLVLNPAR
jgi:tetratricopeptide (TPR) repeat protein